MAGIDIVSSITNCEYFEDNVFDVEVSLQELRICAEHLDIPSWLQNVESPFNWLPNRFSDVPAEEVITKAKERIEMNESFDATFPFEKFVHILTLVFELSHQRGNDQSEALENLNLCEQLVENERDRDVETYNKMSETLTHTAQATRAHLLIRSGKNEEAKQVTESIQPASSMSVSNQAAMQAIKARFFFNYRSQGAKLALKFARKALILVPDEPLWQVVTAEAIRRSRKFQSTTMKVLPEEIALLESTVDKKRSARHLLLLAQVYREYSDFTFKEHRTEPDFFQSETFLGICDQQEKAFELYKEVLSMCPDSEVVNRTCGYGLLKLPAFKSDYQLAKFCLQKALEESPHNPTTLHALGLFYYKGLMDYEKAALFCEKAGKLGNFAASLDMLRMKRLVYGDSYDPVFDFRRLLQQYSNDKAKKHEVLCQMGSYYLFFERNLCKALQYFGVLIKEKADPSIMINHKCTFLNMASKINLLQCIVNEGTQLLQRWADSSAEQESSFKVVKDFLDELRLTNSELFNVPINTDLIRDLHKVSENIKQTYIRKKERRDSLKEKKRNSLYSRRSSLNSITSNFSSNVKRRHSEGVLNIRRRSSGNFSDISQTQIYRNQNNPKHYNQQSSDSGCPQNYPSITDTSFEKRREKTSRNQHIQFNKSNSNIQSCNNGNSITKIKRHESWNGSSVGEHKITENWRSKSGKGFHSTLLLKEKS